LKEKDTKIENIRNTLENNLEIIYRLMSLQSGYGQENMPLSTYKEASQTLKDIMRADGALSQGLPGQWLDFSGYLYSLTDRLMDAFNVNQKNFSVMIRAENIQLKLNTAISCGLIVSELLSEAMKYSAGGGAPVAIKIEMTSEESGRYFLRLSDGGAGLPSLDADAYPLFPGMQIVQDQAAHLEAALDVKTNDQTSIELRFADF